MLKCLVQPGSNSPSPSHKTERPSRHHSKNLAQPGPSAKSIFKLGKSQSYRAFLHLGHVRERWGGPCVLGSFSQIHPRRTSGYGAWIMARRPDNRSCGWQRRMSRTLGDILGSFVDLGRRTLERCINGFRLGKMHGSLSILQLGNLCVAIRAPAKRLAINPLESRL